MSEYIVSNAAELMTVMKKVAGGDVIKLASGTYDKISLTNLKFPGEVTITSLDPSKPAEFTGLGMRYVEGVNFSNLLLTDKSPSTAYDFQVRDSSNISFDKVVIQGIETGELTTNPFMIRTSSDISVTNSEVKNVRYGISMLDNNGVTLSNNYFHDIRTDGIRGGGNSNVTISGNLFTDFCPSATDHPDAIQFWTSGTTTAAKNITITDNVILRGDGAPIQGIFMGDEAKIPYQNVKIDGNLVVGGMYSGISVANAQQLYVTNNTVGSIGDQDSWIFVSGADVLSGNKSETYIINRVNVGLPTGNQYLSPVMDNGRALIMDWLADHSASVPARTLLASNNVALGQLLNMVSAMPAVEVPLVTVVDGTGGADRLKAGKVGDFHLIGGAGNDQFTGGVATTTMEGGAGDDIYNVNSTRDIVVEKDGGGSDTVYTTIDYTMSDHVEQVRLSAADLTVRGNAGDNRMVGSEGRDTLYGETGADTLMGMGGDDYLDGGNGDDQLAGADGSDVLIGGRGIDKLLGGAGDDRMFGGDGDDWMEGGGGADVMTGGAGKENYYYRQADLGSRDTITDFNAAQGDRISVSAIDANTMTIKDDPFRFLGTGSFTKAAGELRYTSVNGGILVEGDVNGDGIADLSIMLLGVSSVTAKDFYL